jgi:hypothetical protein
MMAKAIRVFLACIAVGALCPGQPAYAGTPAYGAGAIERCAFGSVTEQTAATDIAAQVRLQGHRCEGSVNAQRDSGQSRADEPVWILTCGNATYRIRLVPNLAARIERLR